jgi:ribosomal protein S10
MLYTCEYCDYQTDRKDTLKRHYDSNRHKINEKNNNDKNKEQDIVKKIKEEYECKIDEYKRENMTLIKKYKKYKKYKKKYDDEIKNRLIYLEQNKQNIEKILEKSLENNNIVAKTTKKSISAINYLIKNCANSHSIESYNIDSIKNNDLLKIAFNPKHMGVVITNLCVTIDGIDKSGIRCMDYNRLKFGVNIGGSWVTDTTGNIIKDKIIKPVKDKAYKCLNQWMTELTTRGNVPTEDIKKYQKGIENIRALDDDKMQNIILKKLGSNCMIDRDKLSFL